MLLDVISTEEYNNKLAIVSVQRREKPIQLRPRKFSGMVTIIENTIPPIFIPKSVGNMLHIRAYLIRERKANLKSPPKAGCHPR
jgi:hypothetical protein